MNLILFLYITVFFSLVLGEFGQFPFGKSDFSISVTDILLTLNLCTALIWTIGIKKNLNLPRNFIYLNLFWAAGVLSLFFSFDLSGWFYLLRFIIYSSSFYLTYYLVKSGILDLYKFLTLVKITSVVLAFMGLIQLVVFPDLEILSEFGYDPHKYRVFSTFLDPNFLGVFLNFGLSLLIFELTSKRFSGLVDFVKRNKSTVVSSAVLAAAIILTFSRSAYLMLAITLVIILAVRSRRLLGAFFIAALILYLVFPAFNARIQGAINIDRSAGERFFSWGKGLTIFQENPILGVGFNNIRSYSQRKNLLRVFSEDGGNSGAGIDSSLIFILATTGFVGFTGFVLFLVKIIADLIQGFTSAGKVFYKPNILSLPLFGLTLGLIVGSFFINSLFFPQVMFLWFSLLGVFYGLGEGEGEGS